MGCTSSRINVTYEEAAIINGENLLLYYNHNINDIFKLFQTNSKEGNVSKKHWKEIQKELGNISDESQQAKVNEFYKGIKTEKELKLSVLTTIAVLLCKGSGADKASVFFDAHDAKKLGQLPKSDVGAMIDELIEFASVKLPTLASPSDSVNTYTEEGMQVYKDRMKCGRNKDRDALLNAVSVDQEMVEKSVFVAWFSKEDNGEWLRSTGLRTHLKKTGKRGTKDVKSKPVEEEAEKPKENAEETGGKHRKKKVEAPEGS
ncbi:hypothetical protein SteCoe_24952 [Stentor coeruleus]|uniref:Uncharacterized protein n=1 Tax=Stentor coeruleus TaxID=5963 RepID=A0A1R2BGG1_9CILI|nr:hypothetical protein SteCoe_24952 [Stentor coeruleus]